MKDLQTIANAGVGGHPELAQIYPQAVAELANFDVRTTASDIPLTETSDPLTLWKVISSAALWILLLVTGVPYVACTSKKISGRTIGIGLFFLTCAALFAWIGALIPTLYNPWVNFLALPAAQFAALFVMIRKLKPAREG